MLGLLDAGPVPQHSTATLSIPQKIGPTRTLFDIRDLDERINWSKSLSGDTAKTVADALRRAKELGPVRSLAPVPSVAAIALLQRDFPHCGAVTELLLQRCALARCGGDAAAMTLPPMLLTGDPGVGKSALAAAIARLLQVPCRHVDMASLYTSFSIVGLDVGYATGRPGAIWDALNDPCMSPVVVLDELDKARSGSGDDPTAFLYSLLEPLTAVRFVDAAIGLTIDASRVFWIATSNDESALHPAIRSRFAVLPINAPTSDQMPPIIASIQRALLADAEWACFFERDLEPEVMDELSSLTPREVRRALEAAYARAALNGRRELIREDVQATGSPTRHRMGFL